MGGPSAEREPHHFVELKYFQNEEWEENAANGQNVEPCSA